MIPDVPPKIFTLSAVTIGYLLLDDTTAEEQNALGNWLMLVAQVICTNGFYKQLQNARTGNKQSYDTVAMLQKMVNAMNREIEELKRQNKKD